AGQAARAARSSARPCCREAARCAGEGIRASASTSSRAQPAGSAHAAAASPAATAPAVRSRPRRNTARSSTVRSQPAATAASTPPECACPPAGSRESASISSPARPVAEPFALAVLPFTRTASTYLGCLLPTLPQNLRPRPEPCELSDVAEFSGPLERPDDQ